MQRIQGLDSIRFICAAIVMIGHFGVPWAFVFGNSDNIYLEILHKLSGVLFNGPAAVIVFFVISGMCIHLPYARGQSLVVLPYYVRRFTRIGVPAVLAALLYVLLQETPKSWNDTVFWSIFCEAAYYLIFPILLAMRLKYGWPVLIGASYVISIVLAVANQDLLRAASNGYVAFGSWTWVIGLPCWLLGCMLAETYRRFPVLSARMIWLTRLFVFGLSVILRIVKFHADSIISSNVITLNLFAFVIVLWLGLEVAYWSQNKIWVPLERAGGWSYSLYLIHPIAPAIILIVSNIGSSAGRSLIFVFGAIVFSYIFFVLCERPSHRLAAYLGKRLSVQGSAS